MTTTRFAGPSVGLLLAATLAACGHTTATPGASTPVAPTSSSSPTSSGRSESFPAPSYHYRLTISRFGPLGGTPLLVTVRDRVVTRVQYAAPSPKGSTERWARGDDIPTMEFGAVTLDEVIADTRRSDQNPPVVDWPAGQAYPSSVSVDPWADAIDDEYTYAVSHVVIDG